MIATVTLNPSIDKTLTLKTLRIGGINRAIETILDPGGKGVNVSRALAAMGVPTRAIMICGDYGREWMENAMHSRNIEHDIIASGEFTRSNITLVHDGGEITKINEPGTALTDDDLDQVRVAIRRSRAEWVVLGGRGNPGLPDTTYRDLAIYAKNLGSKVAIDSSGDEMRFAMDAGVVDLIKPNQFELAELVARPLTTIGDVIDASREVMKKGVDKVLCSLGKDGALLITQDGAIHCEATVDAVGNPVGAGDILLGTFLGAGADESALEVGVAWSAASVQLEGTAIPTPSQASAMKVTRHPVINRERALVEVE